MDLFVPVPSFDASLLKGTTLILPSVSFGNVPQLTLDLLVHTLETERVGFLDDNAIMSVSGVQESGTGVLTPIEVYQTTDRQWTLIHQHAPPFRGKRKSFTENMAAFITKHEFSRVIILTSADKAMRRDVQILSDIQIRVLYDGDNNTLAESAMSHGIPALEREDSEETTSSPNEKWSKLPGAGFALTLHNLLAARSVPTTTFSMFVFEGDNSQDGLAFADKLDTLLNLRTKAQDWTPPRSWEYLFGSPPNPELYQ